MTSRLAAEYRSRAALAMPHSDIREQMPVLYAWARHATRVIELGVRTGFSTIALLAATEGRGELWSVDLDPPLVPDWWRDLEHWHVHIGDDATPEAAGFCPAQADLLFIDTSHYYTHTMAELDIYVPKLRPGGTVLLHDTGPEWPDVTKALNDYCPAAGLDWYDHPAWPGLGVIEIPE